MNVRPAKRILTGMPMDRQAQVALGARRDGTLGISLQMRGHENVAFTDPDIVEEIARALLAGAEYLRGDSHKGLRIVRFYEESSVEHWVD